MFRQKLDEFACIVLINVICAARALKRMALHNPRSTGAGFAGFAVIAGAHFGLHLSPGWVAGIASFVALFIGTLAGDNHHRRPQ